MYFMPKKLHFPMLLLIIRYKRKLANKEFFFKKKREEEKRKAVSQYSLPLHHNLDYTFDR